MWLWGSDLSALSDFKEAEYSEWRTLVFCNNCGPAIVSSRFTHLMQTVPQTQVGYSHPWTSPGGRKAGKGLPTRSVDLAPLGLWMLLKLLYAGGTVKGFQGIHTCGVKASVTNRVSTLPATVHALGALMFWTNTQHSWLYMDSVNSTNHTLKKYFLKILFVLKHVHQLLPLLLGQYGLITIYTEFILCCKL